MFRAVRAYVAERKQGIGKVTAVVGSLYFLKTFIQDRLQEVKEKLQQERNARENLKRRFDQTQDDISYTTLALIQTLADQVLDGLDVEGLTQELQSRSKARHATQQRLPPQHHYERPPSSISSSIDLVQEHDLQTGSSSSSFSISSRNIEDVSSSSSKTSSWLETSGSLVSRRGGEDSADIAVGQTADNISIAETTPSELEMMSSTTSETSPVRTNAELWNQVKILTLTRTLTALYSTTLLSLLTSLQLTLLARSKYVQSVVTLEQDERMKAQIEAEFSLSNMLLRSGTLEKLINGDMDGLLGGNGDESEEARGVEFEPINEEVENRFLTLSWWILHVGWKDIGERVRKGVEEVFEGVSLKSKLSAIDLHRLVSDVRRRVEHEITFEGNERRINFSSSLLPPTPEMVQHVLTRGGFPSLSRPPLELSELDDVSLTSSQHSFFSAAVEASLQPTQSYPYSQPAAFTSLFEEMGGIITSVDFMYVLEVCLDRATEILFANLEKNVFVDSEQQPGVTGVGIGASREPVRIRLAGLLPGLARWSQLSMRGLPNELVDNLLNMREMKCLNAIVFAKFEDWLR